jgi:hypothetical protein
MKTQAWGWLVAGVLAAGLNASYHDGGLEWAHRAVDQLEQRSEAMLALATPRAGEFLTEVRLLASRNEAACPFATRMARVQEEVDAETAQSDTELGRLQAMSARQQARFARLEANRARIEARIARLRIPAIAVDPVIPAPRIDVCPRVHVNIPGPPVIKMPMVPVIHIETPGAGPV